VSEKIEYHFRVSNAAVFTLYSYSKALEYLLFFLSLSTGSPTAVSDVPPCGRHVGPDVATVCLGVSFLSVKRAAAGGREAAGNHGPRARPSFSGSGPALDHHERTTTAVVVA
jgi:hypothetical protein